MFGKAAGGRESKGVGGGREVEVEFLGARFVLSISPTRTQISASRLLGSGYDDTLGLLIYVTTTFQSSGLRLSDSLVH